MGQKHSSVVACIDTGVLTAGHQVENSKLGVGAAAIARRKGAIYVAGNKGLAVFPARAPPLQRVRKLETGAISPHSGAAIEFLEESSDPRPLMYIAGGNGLAVFDVTSPLEPQLVTAAKSTGASSWGGGAAMCLHGKDLLYIAGGLGLAVMSLRDPANPTRLGEVINTGAIFGSGGAALRLMKDATHDETLLYVAGGYGVAVYTLADPERPQKVCEPIDTGCISREGCAAFGDAGVPECLFVAGGKGLAVLSVLEPRAPQVKCKVDTGVLAFHGGVRMALGGQGRSLFIAGGKGLGIFAVPDAQAMLAGHGPTCLAKINTGALTGDNDTGLVFGEGDEGGGLLYVAGGSGLAVIDLAKLPLAATSNVPLITDVEIVATPA